MEENKQTTESVRKRKINIFRILIPIISVIAVIGLFLPYEQSTGEYREYLEKYPTWENIKEVNYNNGDVIDLTMIENLNVYMYMMTSTNYYYMQGTGIVNVVLTIALITSIVLIMLFGLLNKPVVTLIFSILMAISSILMNTDIVSRGVIPGKNYTFGISFFLFIPLALIIFVCSIINIVKKRKAKRLAVN